MGNTGHWKMKNTPLACRKQNKELLSPPLFPFFVIHVIVKPKCGRVEMMKLQKAIQRRKVWMHGLASHFFLVSPCHSPCRLSFSHPSGINGVNEGGGGGGGIDLLSCDDVESV